MSPRKYLIVFLVILGFLASTILVFNRVVDPFDYYRDIRIKGLNLVKTKFRFYERQVKPAIVMREQPVSLIFGSSFSEIGFDPRHPTLNRNGKGYNFALAGAGWEIILCSVKYALKHDKALKEIILGIHPQQMPDDPCTTQINDQENPDTRAFLFSFDALLKSINTVSEQSLGKPSHTEEGMYYYNRGDEGTSNRFRRYFSSHLPCGKERLEQQRNSFSTPENFNKETLETQVDLSGLRKIIHESIQKGIEIKLIVFPRHAMALELEYICGNRSSRWAVLSQIATLVETEGKGMVQLWDFDGYHSVSTEKISNKAGYYWQDPVHFNYEFGNMMIDEIYGLEPRKFGNRLTQDNILKNFTNENIDRAIYLNANPDFIDKLFDHID